ncbi:MAG: hypothetical protein HY833_01825 [Candidatus Aenigmarchaeota archaeon]|nr:hypothetical protein [Candidatus Aenigmarchaeota archaeon]
MTGRGSYDIGITSGWYGIAKSSDLLGLAQKISAATTSGANFVQVDFENTAEFVEPDVIDRLRQTMQSLQLFWGAHGEIGETMAWESSIDVHWKQSHRRLHQYLDGLYDYFVMGKDTRNPGDKSQYFKFRPYYLNFHASNSHPLGLFVEKFRYSGHIQACIDGSDSWEDFLNKPYNVELKKWFQRNVLYHIYARETGRLYLNEEEVIDAMVRSFLGKRQSSGGKQSEEETKKEYAEFMAAFKEPSKDENKQQEIFNSAFEDWLTMSALRRVRGMIIEEEWAYALIAKYLEFRRGDSDEPLWNMFFGSKKMEDLEKEWSTKDKEIKLFDKKKGLVNLFPEIIAMVATRYIIGHFKEKASPEMIQDKKLELARKKKEWDPFYEKTALEKLNEVKVVITFETPDVLENQREGLQRIIHARHIHLMVKAFNHPYIKGWIDAEHYLHNGFDPIDEIRSCPDGSLEDFTGFHVGSPKPYAPGHDLIDVGSEGQRWIYVYAYEMRKKGFGMKDRGLIIFERGGGRGGGNMPVHYLGQSVTSIRLIIDELKKDTEPNKLPLAFFGVSSDGFQSMERQTAIMKEHYWDPLKGMLSVPEEEYTFFGKAALDKGKKPEEWKKEELR